MYATGQYLTPVPIEPPPGARGDRKRKKHRRRGAGLGNYVSEYVGDPALVDAIGDGEAIATEYVGDHYDDVVHRAEIPLQGMGRRRARRHVLESEQLEGLSLKKIGKTVAKAAKDTGKVVGKVVTSKVGKAVTGLALAATGVGAPAAAAIGAGIQAGGAAAKGARLKTIAKEGAIGGAIGGASAVAGKQVRRIAADRKAKKLDAAQAARLKALPSEIPKVGVTASTAPATEIRELATAPASVLRAEDQTPASVKRRVRKEPTIGDKVETAQKVLSAGTAAKATANKAADKADAASKRADRLARALDQAKKAGDILGIKEISGPAADAAEAARLASETAARAADQARGAGNAIEGATQGAVGGGILGPIGEFVENNKPLVYGGLGVVALVLVMRSMPARAPRAA